MDEDRPLSGNANFGNEFPLPSESLPSDSNEDQNNDVDNRPLEARLIDKVVFLK